MGILRWIAGLFAVAVIAAVFAAVIVLYGFHHYGRDLPDYKQLADYNPPMVTRVHAGDGRLLTEFAIEKRIFVPIQAIPKRVISAFLSAEDKNFYRHPGVDLLSIGRAAATNVMNYGRNRRPVGASTITQQVAKNFLLTNEVSIERKIKEAILAIRIEHAFSKEQILELYLNEIYLGLGSYGVAAAALNYFNKSLDQLTLAEAAYLAALPKAPNNYHPVRRHEAAVARRDWVIGRMAEDGRVSPDEAKTAQAEPLAMRERDATEVAEAAFFAEEVRREVVRLYGEDELYEGGLSIRTTVDPKLQRLADKSLRDGLIAYDRRHGWRGAIGQIDPATENWQDALAAIVKPQGVDDWQLAAVLATSAEDVSIALADGSTGSIPLAELRWARPWMEDQNVGPEPTKPADVLNVGDVVLVEGVEVGPDEVAYPEGSYGLRQVPDVNGAIVALDPHTGRVLAMSGGFSQQESEFNRAVQARRQPGSAFKPIVYLAALDNGFTPSTQVLDAPFVIDQGEGQGKWKPANYTRKFYGPTPMRVGIEKSRNLMTVRLAQAVGMDKIVDYARRMGIVDDMPPVLSMALGAGETTLMRLTTFYAMLVNGGKRINPTLIDRIQDRNGKTIFKHDNRPCNACRALFWEDQAVPAVPDQREQVADPGSAYQVVAMLKGVVDRGTGRRISSVGKPLAGKTGTTNDSLDTWFVGFSPDLAVGVFVGFDQPKPLGRRETGSSVAAPVFRDFMAGALEDRPALPFRIPEGIQLVRVDGQTGRRARAGDRGALLEAFKVGTGPETQQSLIESDDNPVASKGNASTGGLY